MGHYEIDVLNDGHGFCLTTEAVTQFSQSAMAKFVIAGKANCPHYARAELLGDYLQRNLPHFSIHKWLIEENDWDRWVKTTFEKNQWKPISYESPLIWRELIDRGGRGTLVGGLNEFQEYAQSYYGVLIDHFMKNSSALFRSIADENLLQYQEDLQAKKNFIKENVHPYHIAIVGADHPSLYALFPDLLSSKLFPNKNLSIRLITDDQSNLGSLKAIAMEIEDLACEQFHQIDIGLENDEKYSYENIDLLLVIDDFFRLEKENHFHALVMEKARLKQNYDDANLFEDERPPFEPTRKTYDYKLAFARYKSLAERVQRTMKPSCRILLACSTSTMIATRAFTQTMNDVPSNQILGLARTTENLAKARIGKRLQVDIQNIANLHIIGDINGSYIIETSICETVNHEGAIWAKSFARNATELLADNKWLKDSISKEVDNRDFELYTHVEHNRTLVQTQASSIISFIKDWINGSADDNRSYSCVMSCSISILGLSETTEEEDMPSSIVCSIPIRMKDEDQIEMVQLNLSTENRIILAGIIKDMQTKYQFD